MQNLNPRRWAWTPLGGITRSATSSYSSCSRCSAGSLSWDPEAQVGSTSEAHGASQVQGESIASGPAFCAFRDSGGTGPPRPPGPDRPRGDSTDKSCETSAAAGCESSHRQAHFGVRSVVSPAAHVRPARTSALATCVMAGATGLRGYSVLGGCFGEGWLADVLEVCQSRGSRKAGSPMTRFHRFTVVLGTTRRGLVKPGTKKGTTGGGPCLSLDSTCSRGSSSLGPAFSLRFSGCLKSERVHLPVSQLLNQAGTARSFRCEGLEEPLLQVAQVMNAVQNDSSGPATKTS